jgi:glycine hydroxymethyltransferase
MNKNPVAAYLAATAPDKVNTALLAYLCNLQEISQVAPEIAASIVNELESQRKRVKLIASENYCSLPVQ